MFSAKFFNRAKSRELRLDGLEFLPLYYQTHAEGGPLQAEIAVRGGLDDLFTLFAMLRCPVEIMDAEADVTWWGFVHTVEIYDGVMAYVMSLDEMANKVAAAYTIATPGLAAVGDRATTAWAEDTDSSGEYGTMELLLSGNNMTATEAENYRDQELARRKYPRVMHRVEPGSKDRLPTAKLICRGWWETLGWVTFARGAGREANANTNGDQAVAGPASTIRSHEVLNGTQDVGAAASNTRVESSFTIAQNWQVTKAAVRIRKEGSPVDNARLRLYTNSGGNPGTLLATGLIAGGDLDTSAAWKVFTLDAAVNMTSGTTYHIQVDRSGANDGTNYYVISVDDGLGYAGGVLQMWNGSAWVPRSVDADLVFRIHAPITRVETSFQLTGGEAWKASNVQIYANIVGAPADNLRVRLYTDSGGAPNTLLATGTFAGGSIPTSPTWVEFALDVEVSLSLATTYHLQVDRSGAVDFENYYEIAVDEDLSYASGALKVYTGTAWIVRTWDGETPDADLAFVIGGVEETTTQIETAIESGGEFLPTVDIEDASGVFKSQYQNGDNRLLSVVQDLLRAGIAGGSELLATVTQDQRVRLYAKPTEPTNAATGQYRMDRRGQVFKGNAPIDPQKCPAGVWIVMSDAPDRHPTPLTGEPGHFFAVQGDFDVAEKVYTPMPQDGRGLYEI